MEWLFGIVLLCVVAAMARKGLEAFRSRRDVYDHLMRGLERGD